MALIKDYLQQFELTHHAVYLSDKLKESLALAFSVSQPSWGATDTHKQRGESKQECESESGEMQKGGGRGQGSLKRHKLPLSTFDMTGGSRTEQPAYNRQVTRYGKKKKLHLRLGIHSLRK